MKDVAYRFQIFQSHAQALGRCRGRSTCRVVSETEVGVKSFSIVQIWMQAVQGLGRDFWPRQQQTTQSHRITGPALFWTWSALVIICLSSLQCNREINTSTDETHFRVLVWALSRLSKPGDDLPSGYTQTERNRDVGGCTAWTQLWLLSNT